MNVQRLLMGSLMAGAIETPRTPPHYIHMLPRIQKNTIKKKLVNGKNICRREINVTRAEAEK